VSIWKTVTRDDLYNHYRTIMLRHNGHRGRRR